MFGAALRDEGMLLWSDSGFAGDTFGPGSLGIQSIRLTWGRGPLVGTLSPWYGKSGGGAEGSSGVGYGLGGYGDGSVGIGGMRGWGRSFE